MATYYVRKTGSDAASGLTPALAWATIGKALGAAGIASGDIVYIGAGTYREVVTVNMTSPTVETKVIADVDGSQTGDSGEVRWTAYLTNDTTAPSSSACVDPNGRDFLTFQDIAFNPGAAQAVLSNLNTSTDIKFYRCAFTTGNTGGNTMFTITSAANVALNWTIDSCTFIKAGNNMFSITPVRPAVADFDLNFIIKNCLFVGGSATIINLAAPSGANTFNPGGVLVYNCTVISVGALIATTANWSTSIPNKVYNCFLYTAAVALNANVSGQIVEDYNVFLSGGSPRTNVTAGSNSKSDGSYAPIFYVGHESYAVGAKLQPFGMPKGESPLLGYGNQASSPTVDILGVTKPTLGSLGCFEIGNTAVRETTTVRTGSNAIKLLNARYQDFEIPVNPVSTTVTVYARYDGTYAGTLPSMNIINGTECGVANATATQVGAADTWEKLSLNFTPTSAGVITVRLVSSTTVAAGAAFFDDLDYF